ncbi:MAG: glycosyltransferase family 2 protein [Bacteroidia bacterium]|nr:glycosyltransferase family 2 protein [Bacteroidia bacterium]
MKITIITPTYNRAHTLSACFDSLKSQTCKDFVWMIVDDGSTDNTEENVKKWASATTDFPIVYLKKANGGKASALNMSFDSLETEYAVVLDSDDTFFPSAIESAIEEIEQCSSSCCCGLMALRHNPDGSVMGGKTLNKGVNVSMLDILNGNYRTELICFYKASVLKNIRFPQFVGEKFVSPQWLDFELSRSCYFVASDSKICICEYITDGLTKNKRSIIKKNPRGYTAVKRQSFEFSNSIKRIVKHGIMYGCGCIISGDNMILNSPRRIWSILLAPFAYFVYFKRFRH